MKCLRSFSMRLFLCLSLLVLLGACSSMGPPETVPAEKQTVSSRPEADDGSPDGEARHCMALAMYWEARGESREGKLAVGSVVLNRVADRRFPDSVCGVVYQGGETPPCQFSWWCDGKSDRPTNRPAWSESLTIAGELLSAGGRDPTNGALFFHNTSMRPPWQRTRTAVIGNHIFYR